MSEQEEVHRQDQTRTEQDQTRPVQTRPDENRLEAEQTRNFSELSQDIQSLALVSLDLLMSFAGFIFNVHSNAVSCVQKLA